MFLVVYGSAVSLQSLVDSARLTQKKKKKKKKKNTASEQD
jgi:hypothetical protein